MIDLNIPIIEMRNISKRYSIKHRKESLRETNLKITQKGIIGLIGPNGAGKSTFLKLIAGLIKPSGGNINVLGKPVSRLISKQLAFLPEVDSLYGFMKIRDMLNFMHATFPNFNLQKSQNILKDLKLDPDKYVYELSKGNRARLKICLCLSRDVPIILLDEPLSGLDPMMRENILRDLVQYTDLENQTLLISSHEVQEIEPFLDYIIFLKEGKVYSFDEAEALRIEHHKSIYQIMKEVYA